MGRLASAVLAAALLVCMVGGCDCKKRKRKVGLRGGDKRGWGLLERPLTRKQIETFERDGVLVLEGVLDDEEVTEALSGLHTSLLRTGVLLITDQGLSISSQSAANLTLLGGGIGGIVDIFYEGWKMKVQEHPRVVGAVAQLYEATYGTNKGIWEHPYGNFSTGCLRNYMDRAGYRLGNQLINSVGINKRTGQPLQFGLFAHVDCHPPDRWAAYSRPPSQSCQRVPMLGGYTRTICRKYHRRWRPIQAFVSLSDALDADRGGFEAASGFHREFGNDQGMRGPRLQDGGFFQGCMTCQNDTWRPGPGYNAQNEFFTFSQDNHEPVVDRVKHVRVPKGSLVMWDWRIPHRNSEQHFGQVPRSVIYTGYLPDVQINRDYVEEQRQNYENFEPPPDFADFHVLNEDTSNTYKMSKLGRRLMGMDSCL